jgi:hypothetical protein
VVVCVANLNLARATPICLKTSRVNLIFRSSQRSRAVPSHAGILSQPSSHAQNISCDRSSPSPR